MKNIGVLIYTYNRVDDAKINMEIIRNVWQSNHLENIEIIHAFNGEKKWYPEKYLENKLVTIKNSWHFQGASDLIDAGIKAFSKNIDYVIVLASDTWLVNSNYLQNLLVRMEENNYLLSTCSWGLAKSNDIRDVGMAVDFFIIDLKWARKYKMFPINYGNFQKKYKDLFLYQKGGNVMLEKLLLARFMEAVGREQKFDGSTRKSAFEKILIMQEREPVHKKIRKDGTWERRMYWPEIGLLTHHEPFSKRKILKKKNVKNGKNIKKLLESSDLSYFNNGVGKVSLSSN